MIRVLVFLAGVSLIAFGATWLADHPGTVLVTWGGRDYQFTTLVGLVAVLAVAAALLAAWSLLRFAFNVPSILSVASRNKRRDKGLRALSRGMMAVGAGDAAGAKRHASDADRLLRHEPMAMLLKAQAAQLSGDRAGAQALFTAMLEHDETRALGLRGLHMEAQRQGDLDGAYRYASEAQKVASLPWAGQAVLQHRAAHGDWAGALKAVERNAAGRLIDRTAANRQRAVLQTAIALDGQEQSPEEALSLAREALRLAPTLVPAAALAGRLLGRKGDLRKAAKVIETAFAATPHPDLADAYVNARSGDSAADRLARAEALARRAPGQPESRLIVARAALEAREFAKARQVMAPLVNGEQGSRPTVRTCLMMADVEEVENGESGTLFEWLQRAARAPHDPAWIADGVISDTWAPVSPVTGRIDAFAWETPDERMSLPERRRLPPRGDATLDRSLPAPPPPDAPPPDFPALEAGEVERVDRVVDLAPAERDAARRAVVFPLKAAPDDPGPAVAKPVSPRAVGNEGLGIDLA